MFRAFSLSVGQLFERPILRVFVMSLALTLLIFAVLGAASVYAARSIALAYELGESGAFAAAAATALLAIGAAWLLFRAVAIAVIGLFGDEIVSAVEQRHYPAAASAARPVSIARSARMGLQSALRAILFNLLALPIYGVLLVTGVGTVLLFAAVNALLLGRDLGEMVAARHMSVSEMPAWLAATRLQRALMGLVVTGLFVVPVANLFAPIIGAAMATHLFHGRRA